jgi:hypothetical protein
MSPDDPTREGVTTADLVAGLPVLAVAVVATVSLAWAHLHHHSLVAVLLSSAVVLAALGVAFARDRRVTSDRRGVLTVLGCGAVAALLFFPGFSYGVGDKDPGVYVMHGVAIARTGSYSLVNPAVAGPVRGVTEDVENARIPGLWVHDHTSGRTVPQFFHLWPALLATAYDVAGYGGAVGMTPLVGVLAVMAFAGLLRRVGGLAAGAVGGLLLATNMIEVWQAKFPSSEMLAQALFVGALLCIVVAAQARSARAAFGAGLLTGVGFLGRADGWLLVMLFCAGLGAVWASGRADRESRWAAAGLALVLPYAIGQAYGPGYAYTVGNHVPGFAATLALLASLAVLAVVARAVVRRLPRAVSLMESPAAQRFAGLAICVVYAALLGVGLLRRRLFGAEPTFDDQNLRRLSWFLTLPGLALAGGGLAVVALRRWRVAAWAVAVPTLLLMPVYVWHAQVASRLMWWTRRYAPHVLPGVVALVALALAFGFAWRWRGRRVLLAPAALAAAYLLAVFLSQSLPLRSHDEWHGSFGVGERIAALSGDARGIYLWEQAPCCNAGYELFAGPVWLERGKLSLLLPSDADWSAYVATIRAAFPGDPLFVVLDGPSPPGFPGATEVARFAGTFPFWEESDTARPSREREVPYAVTVYRVP